ncbi:DUF5819 family protein [Bacillus atrophaeus]|uniref:DUF5819 family protein n=1 Tax=Bacillus atrophaeus TaxID=1452 RepID=UPI000B456885|nr:DUF5819 family protein [Bacillus atrophaeus]ARW08906.1 hypothetical protein S101359_03928 [Bacillus atrophaeus]ATO27065.1 hypothetical protein RA13_02765 [Bacillus atrophaeus]MCY8858268.1 DUF5819 family protein [Bacillus atrophaeus]MED1122112.1 DUF5819 family protein [Bacillus atrophaeus]QUF65280.1 hypothetical protein KCX77_19875 [Bacillus atrophaeus]
MKKVMFLVPILLSGVLIFHFMIVILNVMPMNPISNKYKKEISEYMEPLFVQNWHLFAPDPVSHNESIQVKVGFEGESKSDWIDITTPMIEEMHKNYFSPLNRMARISTGIISELTSEDELVIDYRKKLEESEREEEKIKKLDKQRDEKFQQNEAILYRFGSSYAKYLFPDKRIVNIELRILRQENTPFSKRDNRVENLWNVVKQFKEKEIIEDVVPIL